ncbi:unnamed protein product [Adineta steineri]|uniref:EF-hand domain-containing protein n=1 Tax=Adineta steineri TaxID=433720 RepID=A0A814NMK4_9BILA|nr:unnamed protein product [Adineta steineri]CAF0981847.1 unnamed protein product [Adineta steineri]CAF1095778.1 unnamed protein product [Adineta steineri]
MGHQKSKFIYEQHTVKHNMLLAPRQILYICQQTNLVDREVHRRYAEFLNICKDGRMIKEQFTTVLQEIWPTGNVEKFSNYLFNLCDKNGRGFIEFTEFIILNCQLNNDKSYLGFLFDIIDIHKEGYLSREAIEPLFASMFELIGHPLDEQSGANISQRHITHLIQMVDESKKKRLSREQFMNMADTDWTDQDNGIGTLLFEYSC